MFGYTNVTPNQRACSYCSMISFTTVCLCLIIRMSLQIKELVLIVVLYRLQLCVCIWLYECHSKSKSLFLLQYDIVNTSVSAFAYTNVTPNQRACSYCSMISFTTVCLHLVIRMSLQIKELVRIAVWSRLQLCVYIWFYECHSKSKSFFLLQYDLVYNCVSIFDYTNVTPNQRACSYCSIISFTTVCLHLVIRMSLQIKELVLIAVWYR